MNLCPVTAERGTTGAEGTGLPVTDLGGDSGATVGRQTTLPDGLARPVGVGDAAPGFTLPAARGGTLSLYEVTGAGSRVLLVFLRHLG